MDTGGGPPYHVIRNGERSNGGIMSTQPGEPPNWVPYFAVESLDGALAAAGEGGGGVLAGPIPMPAGRIGARRRSVRSRCCRSTISRAMRARSSSPTA